MAAVAMVEFALKTQVRQREMKGMKGDRELCTAAVAQDEFAFKFASGR